VRGLLSRSTEEVELTRVRDVSYEQGLAQRALGIGTVAVIGTDATTPTIKLHDVDEPEQVKELIRQAVRDQRQRQHVRQIEGDELA
jgi:membrane protein YdbS with pleckstrin-like domain